MSEIEIGSLMNGISKAIKEAQELIEDQSRESFNRYFVTENTNKKDSVPLRPKMMKIQIPNVAGEYVEKNVPIVSLVNHHSLQLEEVRLKMQVTGSWDSETNKLMVTIEPIRHDLDANERKYEKYIDVDLIFKKNDAPEGVQRILLDHYKVL
jgi:Protein of unknown function (DUF2589).